MDLRTYQLMRNIIAGSSQKKAGNSREEIHGTLMKRTVAKKDILLNSEEYNIAMDRAKAVAAELEKAYYYFNKVYKQFKFDPRFLHIFALIYLANEDIENARKCLQEIRLVDPEYKLLKQLALLLS
jgi:tetratricopeptide (TPR) repeat protein